MLFLFCRYINNTKVRIKIKNKVLRNTANIDLSNLSAAGQAKFDAKANVSNTVTTDTPQTITGFKAFNNGSGNIRTNIDIITNDGVGEEDANAKWAGSIQFKKGNVNVGYCEAMRDNINSSITQIVAHNSVNGQDVYSPLRAVVTSDGNTLATAPTTPVAASGNVIVTADYALDKFVTKDTEQTISGSKRFTQPSKSMSIELIADTNQQTIPATNVFRQLGLYRNSTYTKGDGYTSWLSGYRGADGQSYTELCVRRFLESDSQEIINSLSVAIAANGTPVSYTKTPPIVSSGGEIVTAGWFNSKMQVVSALPANPDPNVFYFIPE